MTDDPDPARLTASAPPLLLDAAPDPAPPLPHARVPLVRLAPGVYGVVILFALGYALFSGDLDVVFGTRAPTWGPLLGAVGIAAVLVAVWRVGARSWAPLKRATDELTHVIGPIRFWDAVLVAVLSGFAEELLFRGALWWSLGLLGSASLFALVHVLPKKALWVYPVFAAVAGLLLGLLREASDSTVPPMVAHILVNAFNLAWIGSRARSAATPTVPAA